MTTLAYALAGGWVFLLGATVGSFANVCIYRIALEKSIVWPGSHCPRCYTAIAFRDNVPILGWMALRGRCRNCGLPIAARYPLIELLSGLLFVALYLTDLVYGGRDMLETQDFARLGYHLLLLAFLLVATFIDFDYYLLPDSLTFTGMIAGLAIGTLIPEARPAPNHVETAWAGFMVGLVGLLAGGGTIWAIRLLGGWMFGREAMGFGDVTLMAMIGSFLGWQVIAPTLFLATILGLAQAAYKLARWLRKVLMRRKSSAADREIPFGPYLSMASLILMLAWPWFWKGWLGPFYGNVAQAWRYVTTGGLD
jgi:leader peptidase (prepilin peptidase)/N-methyltransferase